MGEFLHRIQHSPAGSLLLLPSPFVTLLRDGPRVRLFGPHSRVWHLHGVRQGVLALCTPNLIKVLLGHPRLFVNKGFSAVEMPLLTPFQEFDPRRWPELLRDVRESVPLHFDEEIFLERWQGIVAGDGAARATVSQRQEERIFRRYAGQPPTPIIQQIRLSAQLGADIVAREHTPLGKYADQSHYIRESRKFTGRTPSYWVNTSPAHYGWDGSALGPPSAGDVEITHDRSRY
ncbi:helix-turn-helix domain-containing protein [Phytoactinopolyspora mesophila]|uniref:Uncharacterized protein n=1 Tax=Phytoactinopolyspora mesophila TaxID=2650750 RepID=A0A7K3MA13_9ACTN|nr:helix-turn-helix domain-containing protein [Phytoactinopolyspora mesophila]NDL59238.1 hypothetical protein [Phytoactinopolyspora mesophila]